MQLIKYNYVFCHWKLLKVYSENIKFIISSFKKYLLSLHFIAATMLGIWDPVINKIDIVLPLSKLVDLNSSLCVGGME